MSAVKSFHQMRGKKGEADRRLNEVLFLFLRVHVVPLGVDDGRVCVGGVLRTFGLVC